MLVQVADRLRTTAKCQSLSSVDPDCMLEMNIARLGGDEFSVFIETLSSKNRAQVVAQNILKEIEKDFDLGNKISASIGIAYYPEGASTPYALLQMATGFSSLGTLAELPADVIKIDKLFIDQAHDNPKFGKVLASISELGKNLDLKMVAEGVEQADQFALVRKLGIQCVQGFLISRPETSINIGAKVLEQKIAANGTSFWLPEEASYDNKNIINQLLSLFDNLLVI